jgi:hypothetical protein
MTSGSGRRQALFRSEIDVGTKRVVVTMGAVLAVGVLAVASSCAPLSPAPATSSPTMSSPTAAPLPSPSEGPAGPSLPSPEVTPPQSYMLAQPTPQHAFGGGWAKSGPFTFTLLLYRDDRFDPVTWVAPWSYSDVPGVGVYMDWVYRGPSISGPVEESWGPESDLRLTGRLDFVADGYHGGRAGGGILLPASASPGDAASGVMMVETPQGCYGAALNFVLVEGPDGLEVKDISTEALPREQLRRLCQ